MLFNNYDISLFVLQSKIYTTDVNSTCCHNGHNHINRLQKLIIDKSCDGRYDNIVVKFIHFVNVL